MSDLNIKERLDEVAQAGIDSLKIEGRMKSPEYVYAVTRAYRETLDAVDGEGKTPSITEKELAQVFNRSFTDGRLFGEKTYGSVEQFVKKGLYLTPKAQEELKTKYLI